MKTNLKTRSRFNALRRFLVLYQEATDIYGLIHARFILTPKGLALMREKYLLGKFGICPRVLCERQNVLPIGMSEDIRTSRVKVYCPRCEDVYMPKKKYPDVDGAYFGCSFPHILLMVTPVVITDLRGLDTHFSTEHLHSKDLRIQDL